MASKTLRAPTLDEKTAKTVAYFASLMAIGMAVAALGATLRDLAENTGSPYSQISILFTARSLGFLLGALQVGRLFDRLPGHAVIAAALLLVAGALTATPLISMLWLLAVATFLLGIGESGIDIGANTLLVWVHGQKVGPYMNAMHFFFGVGAFASPIIIAQIDQLSGDITWAYWALALLMLPVALGMVRLSSPIIRKTGPTASENRRANRLVIGLIGLFFFLYVGAEISFGGWLTSYTIALNLSTETVARYLTSTFWGALTVGRLLSVPLATRLRPRVIIGAALAGCLLSITVLLVWGQSLAAIWVGTLGIGLSMAPIFPVTLVLAEHRLPLTGAINGWIFAGGSLGGMTVPWFIGQFFERTGPTITMVIIAADLLLTVVVFVLLLTKTEPETTQSVERKK